MMCGCSAFNSNITTTKGPLKALSVYPHIIALTRLPSSNPGRLPEIISTVVKQIPVALPSTYPIREGSAALGPAAAGCQRLFVLSTPAAPHSTVTTWPVAPNRSREVGQHMAGW